MKRRHHAEVAWKRRGGWAVRITLSDGTTFWARPGNTKKVVYDFPERVPRDLKTHVVPRLIDEAKIKNLRGEKP